jgi:hypothetical protein
MEVRYGLLRLQGLDFSRAWAHFVLRKEVEIVTTSTTQQHNENIDQLKSPPDPCNDWTMKKQHST